MHSGPSPQPCSIIACFGNSGGKLIGKPVGAIRRADHRSKPADHVEDLGDTPLVEGMNGNTPPDQRRDDLGLEVDREAMLLIKANIATEAPELISNVILIALCVLG